jgi:hypothetical protein
MDRIDQIKKRIKDPSYCAGAKTDIEDLIEERRILRMALYRVQSMCGIPDINDVPRAILQYCQEVLEGRKE